MTTSKEWMTAKHYNILYFMPGDRITSLNLQNANTAEAMVPLTKAIKKGSMQSLSELDLSKNELRAEGAKIVAESLKVNAQIYARAPLVCVVGWARACTVAAQFPRCVSAFTGGRSG
jgi:hypothetical protein